MNKKNLAIMLSRLEKVNFRSASLEQYETDSEFAATLLWNAFLHGDIQDKVIADLGCGNGILGIGALLLGAKKVYFVDVCDLEIAKKNAYKLNLKNAFFIQKDVREFKQRVDCVIENPPFGVKKKHADKVFLESAFSIAQCVYSIHKAESQAFLNELSKEHWFKVSAVFFSDFFIKKSMPFHKKKKYAVKVGCWLFEKPVT